MELVPEPTTGWHLERRVVIAGALGLVGLGLIIGFKIRGGVPDVIEVPSMRPAGPCTDCAERAIKDARVESGTSAPPAPPSSSGYPPGAFTGEPPATSSGTLWPTVITNGDSSVPDD